MRGICEKCKQEFDMNLTDQADSFSDGTIYGIKCPMCGCVRYLNIPKSQQSNALDILASWALKKEPYPCPIFWYKYGHQLCPYEHFVRERPGRYFYGVDPCNGCEHSCLMVPA